MNQEVYDNLKRGDGIVVRFGEKMGTQYALVLGRDREGFIRVLRWRQRSASWTRHPQQVRPGQIVRRASVGEYRVQPIAGHPAWEKGQ